jgi:hypothetical protein
MREASDDCVPPCSMFVELMSIHIEQEARKKSYKYSKMKKLLFENAAEETSRTPELSD